MKIYIEEYNKNGVWTIKSRTAYTRAILENPEYFKEYVTLHFSDRYFFKLYLKEVQKRKLTKTLIAEVLNVSRFTLYSIIDGNRKLKPREIDLLYTICLDEEYRAILDNFNAYRLRMREQRIAAAKLTQQRAEQRRMSR